MTHYVWEGGKVLGEYNGGTGALQVAYWYVGVRLYKKTGTTTQVFLSDRLSGRLTLSNIGAVVGRQGHLPFGEDFAESGSQQKQHFTSYERDSETGTDYAINRQYAQNMGRFLRTDPESKSCDYKNPQSLNRYAYAKNDPVNRIDPDGREAGKIPSRQEKDHTCNKYEGWDSCKSLGDKIRDWTVSVGIRFFELDTSDRAKYATHWPVWARQKNFLNDCIKKFFDRGNDDNQTPCGPDDLPQGFDMKEAEKRAREKAPPPSSLREAIIDRGGWVPILIGICLVCPACCLVGTIPEVPAPVPVTNITVTSEGWYDDDPELCAECPECCEFDLMNVN